MKVFIICCNDSIEKASLDEEVAKKQLEVLAEAYYKRNFVGRNTYEEYRHICYWHIHEVEMIRE